MKFSESWLREIIDIDLSSEELSAKLTMIGHEVDSFEIDGGGLEGILIAQIVSFEKHPNADRLSLCQVTTDGKNRISIVCGAPNVKQGMKSILALPGKILPNGLKLEKSEIRGIESFGMLCSASEVSLGLDSDGIMELPQEAKIGSSLLSYLNLPDHVIDLDITPNRGDCFSVLGVARDLAATSSQDIKYKFNIKNNITATVEQSIKTAFPDLCPRFSAQAIVNINNESTTPIWMTEKLRKSGIRSINPVVDVTNFVMIELGQPLHAYDLSKINGTIIPRFANEDEQLVLLDETKVELKKNTIVITDDSGPIGMAGIMGGLSTAVSSKTSSVLFEAAYWPPKFMAGVARRYGMHTDASLRFERGVDPEIQKIAINRACELLLLICGGDAGKITDIKNEDHLPKGSTIKLTARRLERILGHEIHYQEVSEILKRLHLKIRENKDSWVVEVPSYRFDLEIEDDLIEEIARIYGFDKIPEHTEVSSRSLFPLDSGLANIEKIANHLCSKEYQEVITYSFIDDSINTLITGKQSKLRLSNPLSSEMSTMRGSIWPGLLNAASRNIARQIDRVRLFEIGKVFEETNHSHNEIEQVAGLITGPSRDKHWSKKSKNVDFFDIKGDLESLLMISSSEMEYEFVPDDNIALQQGQSAKLLLNGKQIGSVGKLHPTLGKRFSIKRDVYLFKLEIVKAFPSILLNVKPISKYPLIRRDISVIVEKDIKASDIIKSIKLIEPEIIQSVKVFDIFEGNNIEEGLKSIALGLILQEKSRTLTDQVADDIISKVIISLEKKFSAKLRE